MDKDKLLSIIHSNIELQTLVYLIDGVEHPGSDRRIYETWNHNGANCYDTIKKIYIELNK